MVAHDKYETDILKALQRIAGSLEKIEKKMPDQPGFSMEKHLFGEPFPWVKSDISLNACEPKEQRWKRQLINGIDQDTTTDAASMNEAFNNMLRDKYPDGCPTAPTECDVQLVKDSMKFLKESLNSAAEYADYMDMEYTDYMIKDAARHYSLEKEE